MYRMVQPRTVEGRATTTASPEQTFAILADAERWPQWSMQDEASLDRDGSPVRDGVGAIRRFRTGRVTVVEEVMEFDPPRRFVYELRSGLALKGYRAEVTLTPIGGSRDGGTEIRWRSQFKAKVPGTGPLYRWKLGQIIQQSADLLAAEATRRATAATEATAAAEATAEAEGLVEAEAAAEKAVK